ncbi:MAG: hypothetical protein ACXAE3_02475 [Candidatus Kariarchaeaceae archaeon]
MSKKLRDSYAKISHDYHAKKSRVWSDFVTFRSSLGWQGQDTILGLGEGNGRNLVDIQATLVVNLDLSIDLLHNFVGPDTAQKIAGALPKTPFRKDSAQGILSLAVIHHFENSSDVIASLNEMKRISNRANIILSVWRRWRRKHREKLFAAIRSGVDTDPLINHLRPWYTSEGELLGRRFYHYYTYRELHDQAKAAGLRIQTHKYLGGKFNDANIFALLVEEER